ncbi:helix-turn-helix domain-containing protein [Solidesulfovibrio sp.]
MGDAREDRGLRREEVMRILGIGRDSYYKLINAKELKAYRINKAFRVRESEVERFRREREA